MTKPTIEQKLNDACDLVELVVSIYNPIAVFGLFSGGHDSFCASVVASLCSQFTGIVHINTGIGIRATREYVRDTCLRYGWPLLEYMAAENVNAKGLPDPQVYADLVRKFGFPGPYGHGMMYQRLKERQLQRLERDYGASMRGKSRKRILLVSGCRSQESERRMANTQEWQVAGRRIWCAPIHDWTKLDTTDLLEYIGQPRNSVVDLIHKSGECLCGAFAQRGEMEELSLWPETREAYAELVALENEVYPKFGWGWEGKPVVKPNGVQKEAGELCWSCDKL